jgi:rhodanese-related sulfurtransferase
MVPWWARFGRVPEVAPRQLQERIMRGEDLQIVDVRTRREFSNGHIAGAVNVPIQSLRRELPGLRLDLSKPVITICRTAHRSIPATQLLTAHGFHASQLTKGMDEWRREGLPVDKS